MDFSKDYGLTKKTYCTDYFQNSLNDIKNTWKGIKEPINLKPSRTKQKINLNINGKLNTSNKDISNAFK